MTIKSLSRSEMSKMTLSAYSWAQNADTNGNRYVSKSEAKTLQPNRPQAVTDAFVVLHAAAVKSKGLTSAVSVGDVYGYSKSLLPEIRNVAIARGNQDNRLDNAELKFLSAPAKALVKFYDELVNHNGKPGRQPAVLQRPKPAPVNP